MTIGRKFYLDENGLDKTYLCTDIGKRTVIGIYLDPNKSPLDFIGPTYSVEEIVFDEDDQCLLVWLE